MADEVRARPASLNGNSNVLVELAGYLQTGRPDSDTATAARAPRTHADVSAEVVGFTSTVLNQYEDAVALLAALSTKLRTAAAEFSVFDQRGADTMISTGRLVLP